MPKEQHQHKMSPEKYAALMKALTEGEYNCRELAEMTDLHYITVLDYCRALHAAKVIYICKWEKDTLGRDSIMVYKLATTHCEDMPRGKVSRAEQQRRYRKRKVLRNRVQLEERLEESSATLRQRLGREPTLVEAVINDVRNGGSF